MIWIDTAKALYNVALRYENAGFNKSAGVAELVDALVLGTSGENRGGSSPSARTN